MYYCAVFSFNICAHPFVLSIHSFTRPSHCIVILNGSSLVVEGVRLGQYFIQSCHGWYSAYLPFAYKSRASVSCSVRGLAYVCGHSVARGVCVFQLDALVFVYFGAWACFVLLATKIVTKLNWTLFGRFLFADGLPPVTLKNIGLTVKAF